MKLVHSFAYNAWPTGNLNVTTKNALDFPGFFKFGFSPVTGWQPPAGYPEGGKKQTSS